MIHTVAAVVDVAVAKIVSVSATRRNKMKINKKQLKQIIKEELMRESGDPVGPQEAQKVAELLQNLGFTLTRGGLNNLIDFMQGLEQSGDLNASPDSRRGTLAEGLHYDGLMEIMVDALKSELGSWQGEAKAQVYEELASKGLDLTKVALNILDDDAGRNPGGSIGE